jgi:hypothetical protein
MERKKHMTIKKISEKDRDRHAFILGKPGRSKKTRPDSHCHGYRLKSKNLKDDVLVKSIYDAAHVSDVCYIVLKTNDSSETYESLAQILARVSDIQITSNQSTDEDFKSLAEINLDNLVQEMRLPEMDEWKNYHMTSYSGYADFMSKQDIWTETQLYFKQK